MENWWVELITEGQTVAARLSLSPSPSLSLSLLPFVIAMMSLNHVHIKYTEGLYIFKITEKINHVMYINDINEFANKNS